MYSEIKHAQVSAGSRANGSGFSKEEREVIIRAYMANPTRPTQAVKEAAKELGRPVSITVVYYHGKKYVAALERATRRAATALEQARRMGNREQIDTLIRTTPTDVLKSARALLRSRRANQHLVPRGPK